MSLPWIFVLGFGLAALAGEAEKPAQPKATAAGEDLGKKSSEPDVCQQIAERMRAAEQRLRQRDSSSQTQRLQQRILDDLTQLIANLEQQSGGTRSADRQERVDKPQPKQQPDGQSTASNKAGSAQASSATRQDAAKEPSGKAELLIRVWGQLPAQLQKQIQSPTQEQFLPGYEQLITEYYQRLTENE